MFPGYCKDDSDADLCYRETRDYINDLIEANESLKRENQELKASLKTLADAYTRAIQQIAGGGRN